MIGATEIKLSPDELPEVCRTLMAEGARLQMAYAWFPEPGTPEVIYLADRKRLEPFPLLRCRLLDGRRELPSLAAITPLLGWYEREIPTLRIRFTGHPEPGPLVLHEGAEPPMPPLDPRYQPEQMMPVHTPAMAVATGRRRRCPAVALRSRRADVLESAQIVFYYVGEGILHCHPRLFFKHRGLEKQFEGLSPLMG